MLIYENAFLNKVLNKAKLWVFFKFDTKDQHNSKLLKKKKKHW